MVHLGGNATAASLDKDLRDAVLSAGKDTLAFADIAYTKTQESSLASLRKVTAVDELPAAELQKLKDLTRKGIWERLKNDPQRSALVKLDCQLGRISESGPAVPGIVFSYSYALSQLPLSVVDI